MGVRLSQFVESLDHASDRDATVRRALSLEPRDAEVSDGLRSHGLGTLSPDRA